VTLSGLNRPLTDLGGIPVLWDSDIGTLVQDPSQGGTNMYGPGDLFRDAATGDIYQLGADGQLALFRVAAPPLVPARPGAIAPSLGAGSAVGSAGPSWQNLAPQPTTTGSTAAITPTGNLNKWGKQAIDWLTRASFIGGVPNGVLVLAGYVAYTFRRQRRRHNPTYRNPGKASRAARSRRRAGERADARYEAEYIRAVRAAPASDERLGRLEQTYALGRRLGRLQRRGVKETRIGRVTYRLNPKGRY
jgi:hypothetical protein